MPTSLKSTDDRLHSPGSAANWRESYYFNFHDAAGRAGLTYISMSPHERKVDRMTMILLPEDKRTLVWIQQDPLPCFEDGVLEDSILKYHCLAPLERWRLQAEGNFLSVPAGQDISSVIAAAQARAASVEHLPVAFDLAFEGCMPVYRFPPRGWDFLGQGQVHFEQMGWVTGRLRIGAKETPFAGWGTRERSWGARDWIRAEWWNWINLQFGEDLFISAVLSRVEGQETSAGFVYRDGVLEPIARVALKTQRGPDDLHLLAAQAHIVTQQGQQFDVDMAPISFLYTTIPRGENWLTHGSETVVSCRCQGLIGRGFAEYVRRERVPPIAGDTRSS